MTKKRKPYFNRAVSLLLVLVMMISIVPLAEITVYSATATISETSADLSVSEEGISLICSLEGFYSKCYKDYSQSSIGYGSKCTGSSAQPHKAGSHSISKSEAKTLLKNQLNNTYAPRVRKQTSGVKMNQNQFDALVSLCYNCGGGTTLISNSPLVKYLKGQLTEKEARTQYSKYIIKAGGSVLQGLINRRNKEADYFFGGSDNNVNGNVEKAVNWAISIANDNTHGYLWGGKGPTNYDCSGLVCAAYKKAGFKVSQVGTSDMLTVFKKAGFTAYKTGSVSLKRGDILLKPNSHTEIYIGDNKCVGAHSNYDGKSGDSSGKEIQVRKKSACTFCSQPKYTYILRYEKASPYTITANSVTASKTTNTSAEFNVGISPEAYVEKIGVFFGTNQNDIEGITTSTKHEKTSKHNYYLLAEWANGKKKSSYTFDTAKKTTKNGWTIKFTPGKTYHYKFVVKINDKWWISKRNYFTAAKDAPAAVTNLSVSNNKIGIGSSTTVTWKKSSKATEYLFSVTNSDGYKDERTIMGVDSTAVQTFALNTAGTYTASVSAKNSSGSSSIVSTTFEVMPDLTVAFDSGIGDPEIRMAHYNKEITTPNAPDREGYRFDGWKNDATGGIVKSATKIANVRDEATYSAIWTPKNYTINIVDGITNKTIKTTSQHFDSEFNVTEFMENTTIPEHEFYQFAGYSEDIYKVKAETHTIYVRYKWSSEYNLGTSITSIQRAKSAQSKTANDGYSIDVEVTAPKCSEGTDQTLKGRVVVALKTDAGRLLLETESAAFVLYPESDEPVTRTINVFVPYEATSDDQLATVIEAYVVNNYYSAGIVSNVATNNDELLRANAEDDYLFSSLPVSLGQIVEGKRVIEVAPERDYFTYTLTTTIAKDTFDSSMDGYTLDINNTRWSDTLWNDYVRYVKEWPSLVSNGGDRFDNTQGAGKEFYNRYNNTPYQASENDSMRVDVIEQPCDHIFYHWCNGRNNGNLEHNVTGKRATDANGNWKYTHFHCHSLSPEQCVENNVVSKYVGGSLNKNAYEYNTSNMSSTWYRDKCTDSKYWISSITVWLQGFYTHKKIYNFTKTEVQDNLRVSSENEIINESNRIIDQKVETFPVNDVTLYTTQSKTPSNITHWYAYRLENNTITHEDRNIVDISDFSVTGYNESKDATLYIYKSTQVSDFTTEYIGNVVVSSNGQILNPDTNEPITEVQTREEISDYTGDYTIAVAVKGETNAMIVGTISAPKPESYKVTFVNATDKTDDNGNIVYNTISEQNVVPGGAAILPDESDIPVKEGYHFVCWNLSTDIVNGDMTVQAIYDKNEYAVVFVDWDSKKLEIKKVKYGESFVTPELPKPADDVDVEWVVGNADDDNAVSLNEWLDNGNVVTQDMIISARYTLKQYKLTVIAPTNMNEPFVDPYPDEEVLDNDDVNPFENTESITEDMEYGDVIQLEEYEEDYSSADVVFMGWKNAETGEYLDDIEIKSDMTIYPVYQFADTVEIPVASVTTGEYDEVQTVTLSCDTENAVIYYSIDGSDPSYDEVNEDDSDPSGVHEYTGPITLTKSCDLKFCAMAMGMNNSGTVVEIYAINTATSGTWYHLVTVYSNLPQEEGAYYQTRIPDSEKFNTTEFGELEGYTFRGLFYDAEGEDEFYSASDLITTETVLYAIYTPKQFTATFNDYDGTTISTSTVDYATAAEAPTPTREGYVFIGWDSDDYEYLTEDKTFTAQYCLESEYATVSLSKSTMTVEEGSDPRALRANVSPDELRDTELLWESNNPDVVSVDQNGLMEFLSEGTATITVTVVVNGESAECTVTVKPSKDKSLYLRGGSILDIDAQRYLRRIPVGANSVAEIKPDFANDGDKLFFFDIIGSPIADDGLVGTGTVVKLMSGDTTLDEIIAIMTGDFNGDGIVNTRDVSMMSQNVLQLRDASDIQILAVDVNGDGDVNVRDCAMMSRYLAGKEDLA